MTSFKSTLVIFASIGLLGCNGALDVGDGDDGPPNPNDPPVGGVTQGETVFQRDILPMVMGCAAGVACHSGAGTDPLKFLGPGGEELYYSAIVQNAQVHGTWNIAQASMVQKLEIAAAETGNHFGFTPFTPDQITKLEAWFAIEKEERAGGDPGNQPISTQQLLAEWSGCMTLDNWELAGMGEWARKGTANGPCANCHSGGEYWIHVNAESATMFEMNRYELFITGFFAAQLNLDGSGEIIPAYDKLIRMGQGNPNGTTHPTYNTDIDNDLNFQALKTFHELTLAAKVAGNCGPPGFPQPQEPQPGL